VFTIDLLKGQGIPIKTMPGGMILVATAFFVPALFAIVTMGNYLHGAIILSSQKKQLSDYEAKIAQLNTGLKTKELLYREANSVSFFLQETADCLKRQMQWSPILEFLARNTPESLVLEQLEVTTTSITKVVPKRSEPDKKVTIVLPKRTLSIVLFGVEQAGNDDAVLELQRGLRTSAVLASKIEDVRIVSQRAEKKKSGIYYELHCVFKAE
jgi:hypothetical protein